MVSFFGFKIGGEKKKKPANNLDTLPPRPPRKDDWDAPRKSQFLSRETAKPTPYRGNVYAATRPNTSHSHKAAAGPPVNPSPYGSNASPIGAKSMSDLRPPNLAVLKQYRSHPNLGNDAFNVSPLDPVPPVPMRNPSRPSTPVKQPPPIWASPLEMNSPKGLPPPPPPAAAAPKPSLAQYELKLKIPAAPSSLYEGEDVSPKAPSPLRIRKPGCSPVREPIPKSGQSPMKPPSPPQSVTTSEDSDHHSPVLSRPTFPRDDMFRPSSRGSHRNAPTTLKEVQNTWEIPDYGPTTLPSPMSTPRGSEDQAPNNSVPNPWGNEHEDDDDDLWTTPIIQTVRARRDTLTSMSSRRRSLEIRVEQLEKPAVTAAALLPQRPKTSNGPQSRQQNQFQQPPRRPMRPPPLNLERGPRPRTPERAGTYPLPAPRTAHQHYEPPAPSTPTGKEDIAAARWRTPRAESRDRAGPPAAAVGARGRPGRSAVRRPNADEYSLPPQMPSQPQAQTRRESTSRDRDSGWGWGWDEEEREEEEEEEEDDDDEQRPVSPESPLMPVTGPLANNRFSSAPPTPEPSQLAPPPRFRSATTTKREPSPLREEEPRSPTTSSYSYSSDAELPPQHQLPPSRLGRRNLPTPDSSQWPLPSPTASSFSRGADPAASASSSPLGFGLGHGGPADYYYHHHHHHHHHRGRDPDSPSPLPTPTRVAFAPRADSPFGMRSLNFSRPMTPTGSGGAAGGFGGELPLRHDGWMLPQPRRAETVPASPGFRGNAPDAAASPSPGRAPPRSATLDNGPPRARGLRTVVGDDFGGGFI
ncbi:hypothetical protein GGR52DRAFT_591085 [Hypoxylon sp. FL1284]|nr:hypothetical protein GGR52DRAFT_591085 [Hypoxylon sp. FL1284]